MFTCICHSDVHAFRYIDWYTFLCVSLSLFSLDCMWQSHTAYLKASWQCVLRFADELISLLYVFAHACSLYYLLWIN